MVSPCLFFLSILIFRQKWENRKKWGGRGDFCVLIWIWVWRRSDLISKFWIWTLTFFLSSIFSFFLPYVKQRGKRKRMDISFWCHCTGQHPSSYQKLTPIGTTCFFKFQSSRSVPWPSISPFWLGTARLDLHRSGSKLCYRLYIIPIINIFIYLWIVLIVIIYCVCLC